MNQQMFYLGVIENRDDPLLLGRYQVRVFGVHSESKLDVPTSALPWAPTLTIYPQNSGIGMSPVYVEGTRVFVFFQDGESLQMPIIMGAYAGIPMSKTAFGENDTQTDVPSTIDTTAPTLSVEPQIDTPSEVEAAPDTIENYYDKIKSALGARESNNNYKAINQIGYVGKYQFGAPALIDTGYLKPGTSHAQLKKYALEYKISGDTSLGSDIFTGKSGVNSIHAWLNSSDAQESAMDSLIKINERTLLRIGVIQDYTTAQEKAGFLSAAHLIGPGGVKKMTAGNVQKDANGVTGDEYYQLGYKAISGKEPNVKPEAVKENNPAREPSAIYGIGTNGPAKTVKTEYGFVDPNGIYPKWTGEQDTSRLMRHQKLAQTSVGYKDGTRMKGVKIGGHDGETWSQPEVPYNTKYPYNMALETESGHVFEFDDTPDNERINLFHTKGTFTEIDRNGTRVTKIVGDDYTILDRNGFLQISGNVNITVDGDANVLVKNNLNIDVNGSLNGRVTGNVKWLVEGRWDVYSHAGIKYHTMGNHSNETYGNLSYTVNGNVVTNNNGQWSLNSVGTITRRTNGDINENASGSTNNNSGANFAVDSAMVYLNSGVAATASAASTDITSVASPGLAPANGTQSFDKLEIPQRNFELMSEFEDTDDTSTPEYAEHNKKLEEEGMIDPNPPTPVEGETKTAESKPSAHDIVLECSDFKTGSIELNTFISPNFTIGQLTGNRKIVAQSGLTDVELACNLKHLALNVLEPIKNKYPDMRINSGLRPMGSNPRSQHPLGKAVDLSFTSHASADYINIAKWIIENVHHDQCILEYRTSAPKRNGEIVTWIHVSYTKTGNRRMYFTMNNDVRVGDIGQLKVITA